jgi:hypothetical protein
MQLDHSERSTENSNVTNLFQVTKTMKNPVLVEVLEYWERLRGGRIAPRRSEIDPREIEAALEHAFILERRADGDLRYRIAGMALADLMGMDVRGMPAETLIDEDHRIGFAHILTGIFNNPEVVELSLEAGHPPLRAQMLLLPMESEQGEISRILGCLVTTGPALATPCRFRITTRKVTRIIASARPVSHSAATPCAQPMTQGFAEAATPFVHRPVRPVRPAAQAPAKHGAPYLRLVKSDET